MKKILVCILVTFIGLPLAAVLIFVTINWNDEPLLPEVKNALAWEPPVHAFENNGYLIFRGMGAPGGQNAAEIGRRVVDSDIESYRAAKTSFDDSYQEQESERLPLNDVKTVQCVYSTEKNCVDFYLTLDKKRVRQLMTSQKDLNDRFIAIQKSEFYAEIAPPNINLRMPSYQYLTFASEFRRMQAVADISNDDIDEGLGIFIDNAQFSRRLLAHSTTLISHMVALAMVQRDLRLLGELVARYPRLASYRQKLLPILAPITSDAYSLGQSLRYERDWQLQAFSDMQARMGENLKKKEIENASPPSKFQAFFLKRNATENLAYKIWSLKIDALEANAPQLDRALSDYEIKKQSLLGFSVGGNYFLYNPVGKILLTVADPAYISYVERQIDTEGYIRLVATQINLIADNVPAIKVGATVLNADKSLRNPYTDQPMEWDAENHELKFKGRVASNLLFNKSNVYTARRPF